MHEERQITRLIDGLRAASAAARVRT
jgi:hypothetical protein